MARTAETADETSAGPTGEYALDPATVLANLGVDAADGLSEAEARARIERWGPNRMGRRRPVPLLHILVRQVASAVVALLATAAFLSALFGDWIGALAVVVVLVINTAIGFFTELRAVRSMEALRGLSVATARVRRSGQTRLLDASELVPGDIVVLEAGDIVPADLRLIRAANLASDEAALTGESLPVDKSAAPVAAGTLLPDRTSMVYKATAITRGTAEGVVTATGLATEVGRISRLVEETEKERSPLERQLDRLSRQLILVTLALTSLIAVSGIVEGRDIVLMAEAGIALAVAAIPEGLPIVATLVLARGMLRMARQNALVDHLPAVETLGATTVILTDKTGTLTQNRMVVERLVLPDGDWLLDAASSCFRPDGHDVSDRNASAPAQSVHRALRAGALCSNATLDPDGQTGTGDPTEIAILRAAAIAGLRRGDLLPDYPLAAEYAFDSRSKRMATVHQHGDGYLVTVKGAPEAILPECSRIASDGGDRDIGPDDIESWHRQSDARAAQGFRMLAVAEKTVGAPSDPVYDGLTFLGLLAIHDPPRGDIAGAVRACRDAGISVIMVTGDHAETARSISAAVGLAEQTEQAVTGHELTGLPEASEDEGHRLRKAAVFARVSPEQKLELIRLHQKSGSVVAMTGDGVNDAPALRQADIGIAMGIRGTQVAKEAADIILQDDSFSTIVSAVREGRVIFGNIRRFAGYLLSCNLSEVLIVGLAVLAGLPLPVLPLQILFLNLVTDVFPAFALGLGEGPDDVLRRPPRDPREPILAARHWRRIVLFGLLITLATLSALVAALHWLHLPNDEAVTVSFLTLASAQLWHVFNMRDLTTPLWRNDVVRNPFVWGALALCATLLAVAMLPPFAGVLAISRLDPSGWVLVLAAGLAPVVLVEAGRAAWLAAR
ncbi:MAG TPA: cation-transporting P-type ATPase [Afifellaceae bacterium]|nr:cation-transporting P-type ATPase [Afifellaceae bacterium]